MMKRLINALVFNLCWLVVVGSQQALLAWAIALTVVTLHLLYMGRGWPELKLVLLVTAAGYAIDQLLFRSGVLALDYGPEAPPAWLHALWPLFAMTLLHACAGMEHWPRLLPLIGGLAGYGSYRLGAAMSDIRFAMPPLSDIALFALWALLFPLLIKLAQTMAQQNQAEAMHARR